MSKLPSATQTRVALACFTPLVICFASTTRTNAQLVGHYEFDNPANLGLATIGTDGSGLNGGIGTSATGVIGSGAIDVSGDLIGLDLGDQFDPVFNSGAFTVTFWMNSAAATSDSPIISWASWNGFDGGNRQGVTIATRGNGSLNLQAAVGNNDNGGGRNTPDAGDGDTVAFADQEWSLVAFTLDGANDTATIHTVVGGLLSSESGAALNSANDMFGSSALTTMVVGEHGPAGGGTTESYGNAIPAQIDDLRIYDTVLSDAEILALALPVQTLALQVRIDRDSGSITLENPNAAPIDIKGYSLLSSQGSFIESNYVSFDDSNVPGWVQLTEPGATGDLSEGHLSVYTLAGNASVALDNGADGAWLRTFEEASDITFSYLDAANNVLQGSVVYDGTTQTDPFSRGDLDFDGDIDSDDWLQYVSGLGKELLGQTPTQAYRNGDLTGDLSNNHADFVEFRTLYENANGVGSFEAMISSVPEPSTWLMALIGGLASWFLLQRDSVV